MKNLNVLRAKDGYTLGEMVANLDSLFNDKLTEETIEEIGNADLVCYKCGVQDKTVEEIEAMNHVINYCGDCYKTFKETYLAKV